MNNLEELYYLLFNEYYNRVIAVEKEPKFTLKKKEEVVRIPKWTDGYGVARTAPEMTTEHLWNVMGYIRDKFKAKGDVTKEKLQKEAPFYFEAKKELEKRGIL